MSILQIGLFSLSWSTYACRAFLYLKEAIMGFNLLQLGQFVLVFSHIRIFFFPISVFQKEKTKGYLNMDLKIGVTNVYYVWLSLKVTSNINIPVFTPTWNAPTWSSRWGHEVWMTFLDWRGLLWPGTASWPQHKKPFWSHGGAKHFR